MLILYSIDIDLSVVLKILLITKSDAANTDAAISL